MMIDNKIPFYSNTPDDTHCFQACLKMIIEHYWPEKQYGWEELDKKTAKVEGLWTWPMAGLIWMKELGLEVKMATVFDYEKFISVGSDYLVEEYGDEVAKAQVKHSDIEQERKISKEFIKKVEIDKRIPEIEDLKTLLKSGFLGVANINIKVINSKPGYAGHFVVIKGYDDAGLLIHDPGLPAHKNRKVDFELFKKAWAHPNERAKEFKAFKLK